MKKPIKELTSEEKRQLVISGFDTANAPLEGLRHPHPAKRHLKPVSSVPVLPDEQIWGNNYHLYRFPDAPSEEPSRTEHALLRSVTMPDGEVRVGYYLTQHQDAAARLAASQQSKAPADYGDPSTDHFLDDSENVRPGLFLLRAHTSECDMKLTCPPISSRHTTSNSCENTNQPTPVISTQSSYSPWNLWQTHCLKMSLLADRPARITPTSTH